MTVAALRLRGRGPDEIYNDIRDATPPSALALWQELFSTVLDDPTQPQWVRVSAMHAVLAAERDAAKARPPARREAS